MTIEASSCGRTATSRSAVAIRRTAWAGIAASSRFLREMWADGSRLSSTACSANARFRQRLFRWAKQQWLCSLSGSTSPIFSQYGKKNYIVLRVDASFGDGWFYEGAGIYRHVWLKKTDAGASGQMGEHGPLHAEGRVGDIGPHRGGRERGQTAEDAKVSWKILDANGKTVATAEAPAQSVPVDWPATYTASASLRIRRCGRSKSRIFIGDGDRVRPAAKARDAERVSFGVRTAVFDADKGFS